MDNMNEPGRQLRKIRERLLLKYRDVTEASQKIASSRNNPEFAVGLSRLADIENKDYVPSIYRLYSLCAIYGADLGAILSLYGVPLAEIAARSAAKLPFAQNPHRRFCDTQESRNRSSREFRKRNRSAAYFLFEPSASPLGQTAAEFD